jgi:hypothetical protein
MHFDSSPKLGMTTLAVNSGPLFIRTVGNGSFSNTYLLNQYDKPFSANYVLMTSNNGLLTPTRDPFLNTLLVASTLTAFRGNFTTLSTTTLLSQSTITSTLSCSTLQSGAATFSTMNVNSSITINGTVLYNKSIRNLTGTNTIYNLKTSDWWGRHIKLFNSSANTTMILSLDQNMLPPDGAFMYITNGVSVYDVTITNLVGGDRVLTYLSTAGMIYNSTMSNWYSFS